MKPARPTCDRHTNLQMVPCWVKRRGAVVAAYACPVPGCDRYRTHEGYLNAADLEVVLEASASARKKGAGSERRTKNSYNSGASNQKQPLNRHAAARAAILAAIDSKRDS